MVALTELVVIMACNWYHGMVCACGKAVVTIAYIMAEGNAVLD